MHSYMYQIVNDLLNLLKLKQMEILKQIENQFSNIDEIKGQLIRPKKIQLHTGIEGFESPKTYGIYRHNGGKPLGVVGDQFEPANLELFLDTIVQSIVDCGSGLDLSKLNYAEYCGGSKVMFDLPIKDIIVKSPQKGDVTKVSLKFSTGFDGKTKFKLSYSIFRIWCSNGCGRWESSIELAFKNTISAQAKMLLFCSEIFKAIESVENYEHTLNRLVNVPITKAQIDEYLTKVTGYSVSEYADLAKKSRNILDKINESVLIEMDNTGKNAYSLLQGITRYTSHEMASVESFEEDILFNPRINKMSQLAHLEINKFLN